MFSNTKRRSTNAVLFVLPGHIRSIKSINWRKFCLPTSHLLTICLRTIYAQKFLPTDLLLTSTIVHKPHYTHDIVVYRLIAYKFYCAQVAHMILLSRQYACQKDIFMTSLRCLYDVFKMFFRHGTYRLITSSIAHKPHCTCNIIAYRSTVDKYWQ